MARTLKTTGVATKLIAALGVDDDNATIRDFVGNSITVDPDVTIPGTDDFNGETIPYFRTKSAAVGTFDGISWNDPEPVLPYGINSKKWTFIGICRDFDSGNWIWGAGILNSESDSYRILSSVFRFRHAGVDHTIGTTPVPTTGSFATCFVYRNGSLAAGNCELYYATEGAAGFGSPDGSAFDSVQTGSGRDLLTFGGITSQGSVTADWFLALWFNDALTDTERDEILAAPMATLFEAASAPNTLTADPGSFAVTGVAAGLKAARRITADAGSFVLTGKDAVLTGPGARTLTAESGTFTLTGGDVGFERAVPFDTAAFVVTGYPATLTYTPAEPVEPQSYTLAAETGSYTLTGIAAALSSTANPWSRVPRAAGTWTRVSP